MPDRDPRSIAVCVAAALAVLALAGWYIARRHAPHGDAGAAPAPAISLATPGGGRLVVDVAGAVRRPGVYRLSAGARVEDALRRAGGARRGADLTQINRAAKLEDGRQVLVPERGPAGAAADAAAGASSATTGAAGSAPAVPLDLNTATLAQLDQLDGVGPATAQKIIDFRRAHGGFQSVDQLNQVPGIGDKRLAALRDHVRV